MAIPICCVMRFRRGQKRQAIKWKRFSSVTKKWVTVGPAMPVKKKVEGMQEEKRPSACIGCGKCAAICPQEIDIPQAMKEFVETLNKIPSWAEICRQREAAQKG